MAEKRQKPETFTNLPDDILLMIADRIPRPNDLKALCLSHRILRAVAVKKLYRMFRLNIDNETAFADNATSEDDSVTCPGLVGFFNSGNPGHEHILGFNFAAPPWKQELTDGEWRDVKSAIEVIPHNKLKRISFPSSQVLDTGAFFSLCLNQRKLHEISFGPVHTTLERVFSHSNFPWDWFQEITTIELPSKIHHEADLHGFQQLIRNSRKLKRLTIGIECVEDSFQDVFHERYILDTVAKSLFSHIGPGLDETPLCLSYLALKKSRLLGTTDDLVRVINFPQLTSLVLVDCPDSGALLRALTREFATGQCALKRLRIEDSEIFGGRVHWHWYGETVQFLRSFVGLEDFHLEEYVKDFDPVAIIIHLLNHRATLKKVTFHVRDADSEKGKKALPNDLVSYLSKEAPSLQEVALIFPGITFEVAEKEKWGDFGIQLSALATLPALRQLRILNWPRAPKQFFTQQKHRNSFAIQQEYMVLLDKFASAVFLRIDAARTSDVKSHLPIMWFGCHERDTLASSVDNKSGEYFPSVCYLPPKGRDKDGKPEGMAARKTISEMSYILPLEEGSIV